MVKAKEFWNYLCKELDYKFFAGVICNGLLPLYKKMDPQMMHYIPAANERIALGLVSGAQMAGINGGMLIDMDFAYDLTRLFMFNIDYKIPFLVIGYSSRGDAHLAYDFPRVFITEAGYKKQLKKVTSKSKAESVPGLVVIEKEVFV